MGERKRDHQCSIWRCKSTWKIISFLRRAGVLIQKRFIVEPLFETKSTMKKAADRQMFILCWTNKHNYFTTALHRGQQDSGQQHKVTETEEARDKKEMDPLDLLEKNTSLSIVGIKFGIANQNMVAELDFDQEHEIANEVDIEVGVVGNLDPRLNFVGSAYKMYFPKHQLEDVLVGIGIGIGR
ncbi:Uncharacterized protein Fot_25282 [Forsythia ovata]|uniref:Uncharacterized protein n=1 Tax=Forsythia ovata TaxID=205694 RepID=A0ABD1U8M9_9LAMI